MSEPTDPKYRPKHPKAQTYVRHSTPDKLPGQQSQQNQRNIMAWDVDAEGLNDKYGFLMVNITTTTRFKTSAVALFSRILTHMLAMLRMLRSKRFRKPETNSCRSPQCAPKLRQHPTTANAAAKLQNQNALLPYYLGVPSIWSLCRALGPDTQQNNCPIERVCFSRKHGEGFFRWVHLSCSHESHYKVSLQGIIIMSKESLQGVIARSHCKESLQGVMARSHCKESWQGVVARSHGKESVQGVTARSHCKESLQGVIARSHCKGSLQVIAMSHCKESLQGVIAGVIARSAGVIARSHCKESLQGVIARSHESYCEICELQGAKRMESSASCKCKESSASCKCKESSASCKCMEASASCKCKESSAIDLRGVKISS